MADDDRYRKLKLAVLLVIGVLGLGAGALVVYNFVSHGWRAGKGAFDISFLTGRKTPRQLESVARSYTFDTLAIRRVDADSLVADIALQRSSNAQAEVRFLLDGEAGDSLVFNAHAWLDGEGTLHVRAAPFPSHSSLAGHASITILLPDRDGVVHTRIGSVAFTNFASTLVARCDRGLIHAIGLHGKFSFQSLDSTVHVEECDGDGLIEAGGAVEMSLNDGRYEITSGGNILALRHFGELSARTDHGSISVQFVGDHPSGVLQSESGNIGAEFLPGSSLLLDVHAPPGAVDFSLPTDSIPEGAILSGTFSTKMNDGGKQVSIRTTSGHVVVREFAPEN